jgi:hypothetical protein
MPEMTAREETIRDNLTRREFWAWFRGELKAGRIHTDEILELPGVKSEVVRAFRFVCIGDLAAEMGPDPDRETP